MLALYHAVGGSAIPQEFYTLIQGMSILFTPLRLIVTIGTISFIESLARILLQSNFSFLTMPAFT